MNRAAVGHMRGRARAGQTIVETVIVVAIVSAIVGTTFLSMTRSRESTLGSLVALRSAFQVASAEAVGSTKTVGVRGATLLFTRDDGGDAVATVYDGLAGSTFTGKVVQRVAIPARMSIGSGSTTSAASTGNLAVLFSAQGDLTYTTWKPGSALSPRDCTQPLTLALETSAGRPMGYAKLTCGDQTLTLEDKHGQPLRAGS